MLFLAVLLAGLGHTLSTSTCASFRTCAECASMPNDNDDISCAWCSKSQKCLPLNSIECLNTNIIIDVLQCPTQPSPQYAYSDDFARSIMLPLSAAAYSMNPQQCLTNAIQGAQLKGQILVFCDAYKSQTCSGFTAYSAVHSAIILSFRGTYKRAQLLSEAHQSIVDPLVPLTGAGKVNKYFYNAFITLWNAGIKDDFLALKEQHPEYELWITGHSLGGSLASIATTFIVQKGLFDSTRLKLVTFGQPRTGNYEYAAEHDKLIHYTYRVIHKNDPVPHMPPKNFRGYYHHLYEVWYDNDMALGQPYIVCPKPESEECSDSVKDNFDPENHLYYFGKYISHYGTAGCVNTTEEESQ